MQGGALSDCLATSESRWAASHVTSFADVLYSTMVVVPGAIVIVGFAWAAMLCCSAYLSRGWHAGLAFVVGVGGWGMLGLTLSESTSSAWKFVWGPFGWYELLFTASMQARFDPLDWRGEPARHLQDLAGAMVVTYLVIIAATLLLARLAFVRIRRLEASA
jgi:hypothetical protein